MRESERERARSERHEGVRETERREISGDKVAATLQMPLTHMSRLKLPS